MSLHFTLLRDTFTEDATLGDLLVDGEHLCWTCEDEDRGLHQHQPLAEIQAAKVRGETAIPTGTYKLAFTWSPRFKRLVLEVQGVPGFAGIRIHAGNTEADTEGCLLPGMERDVAAMHVLRSREAVAELERLVREAGGSATLTITRANPELA